MSGPWYKVTFKEWGCEDFEAEVSNGLTKSGRSRKPSVVKGAWVVFDKDSDRDAFKPLSKHRTFEEAAAQCEVLYRALQAERVLEALP